MLIASRNPPKRAQRGGGLRPIVVTVSSGRSRAHRIGIAGRLALAGGRGKQAPEG